MKKSFIISLFMLISSTIYGQCRTGDIYTFNFAGETITNGKYIGKDEYPTKNTVFTIRKIIKNNQDGTYQFADYGYETQYASNNLARSRAAQYQYKVAEGTLMNDCKCINSKNCVYDGVYIHYGYYYITEDQKNPDFSFYTRGQRWEGFHKFTYNGIYYEADFENGKLQKISKQQRVTSQNVSSLQNLLLGAVLGYGLYKLMTDENTSINNSSNNSGRYSSSQSDAPTSNSAPCKLYAHLVKFDGFYGLRFYRTNSTAEAKIGSANITIKETDAGWEINNGFTNAAASYRNLNSAVEDVFHKMFQPKTGCSSWEYIR